MVGYSRGPSFEVWPSGRRSLERRESGLGMRVGVLPGTEARFGSSSCRTCWHVYDPEPAGLLRCIQADSKSCLTFDHARDRMPIAWNALICSDLRSIKDACFTVRAVHIRPIGATFCKTAYHHLESRFISNLGMCTSLRAVIQPCPQMKELIMSRFSRLFSSFQHIFA
eukprot:scaffold741_cov336-Pavlova_lutheri.AAC.40